MVAMVNQSILPLKIDLPFLGEAIYLSRGLKYNLEFLLFWGPWAPFDSNWHLREEYKQPNRRRELSQHLSKFIGYVGKFLIWSSYHHPLDYVLNQFYSQNRNHKLHPCSIDIAMASAVCIFFLCGNYQKGTWQFGNSKMVSVWETKLATL